MLPAVGAAVLQGAFGSLDLISLEMDPFKVVKFYAALLEAAGVQGPNHSSSS